MVWWSNSYWSISNKSQLAPTVGRNVVKICRQRQGFCWRVILPLPYFICLNWCALVQDRKSLGTCLARSVLEGGPSLQRRDHLIIISSSLGRVLRGGDNAQWDKSLLGDVEHFGVHRDNKVCVCVMGGGTKASSAIGLYAPEREKALLSPL